MGKMSAEELGVLFAGISSVLATLIYFTKNIKQSSCCGNDCKQVVTDQNGNVLNRTLDRSTIDCFDKALTTFPPAQIPAVAPVPAPRSNRHAHPLQAII